jgi:hypothetical protein
MQRTIVTIAIWISGMIAFACIGTTLGYALRPGPIGARDGFFGGIAAFVCLRLWLSERQGQ